MLNNQRDVRKCILCQKGPVTEEKSKWMHFPNIKRNEKSKDKHTDTKSENEKQYNIIRTFFQSTKRLKPTHNNNHNTNPFTQQENESQYQDQHKKYSTNYNTLRPED